MSDNPPSSFRELADRAEVTIPTLRHYFGNREDVFASIFGDCHKGAENELAIARTPRGKFAGSIRELVAHIAAGFEHGGLTALHAAGLVEGLRQIDIAGAYLGEVLEPTIEAVQQRLEQHIAKGEMRPVSARHAALALLSPLIVGWLHQQGLGGSAEYPLQMAEFLQTHTDAFVRGYRAESGLPVIRAR